MNDFIQKYGFDKYFVPDLVTQESEVIFVLESPHVYEVKNAYPVAGKSGKDMSKILFKDENLKKESLGKLIFEDKIQNFAIINISNIPLQEIAYDLNEKNFSSPLLQLLFKDFVRFRQNSSMRKKECSVNKIIKIFQDDFVQRLEPYKNKKIVLCGGFVHKIFNDVFQADDFKAVLEVPHPSFNNWSKVKYKQKIEELLEFVEIKNV